MLSWMMWQNRNWKKNRHSRREARIEDEEYHRTNGKSRRSDSRERSRRVVDGDRPSNRKRGYDDASTSRHRSNDGDDRGYDRHGNDRGYDRHGNDRHGNDRDRSNRKKRSKE